MPIFKYPSNQCEYVSSARGREKLSSSYFGNSGIVLDKTAVSHYGTIADQLTEYYVHTYVVLCQIWLCPLDGLRKWTFGCESTLNSIFGVQNLGFDGIYLKVTIPQLNAYMIRVLGLNCVSSRFVLLGTYCVWDWKVTETLKGGLAECKSLLLTVISRSPTEPWRG